jgi:hypothetical protein
VLGRLISVRLVLPYVPLRKHPVIWSARQGDPDLPWSTLQTTVGDSLARQRKLNPLKVQALVEREGDEKKRNKSGKDVISTCVSWAHSATFPTFFAETT